VRLFLFDVDQTLISTGGAGIRALNRAFQKTFAMDNAMDGVLPHGKTDPAIIREIFAARSANDGFSTDLGPVLEAYLGFLREEVETTALYRILPGIVAILELLKKQPNALIGLATGNVETGARIKLERGNLNQYFAFGGFGSDSENRTELVRQGAARAASSSGRSVDPAETYVIGDTPRDIEAGREAGFLTVGVATGTFTKSQLEAAGATFAITDFETDRDYFLASTRIE